MTPKSNDWCPFKRRKREVWDTKIQGRSPLKDRGEIGAISPQVKECENHQKLEKAKKEISPIASRGSEVLLTP